MKKPGGKRVVRAERIGVLVLVAMRAPMAADAQATNDYTGWSTYGGSSDSLQYSALTQINRRNVSSLEVAWTYEMGESVSMATPVVIDGVMYVPGREGSIVAVDATSGREIWRRDGFNLYTRGLTVWKSDDGKEQRLIYFKDEFMRAIDPRTGADIPEFGVNGGVDLRLGLGRPVDSVGTIQPYTPGKLFGSILITGSNPGENYGGAPGDIRAFDVRTGRQIWTFHTVPHPGEEGHESWQNPEGWKTASGANNWSGLSVDQARGIVYAPLGSASYDFWGGDRLGANLYSDSLVALDARTGKRLWHFQTVHHDLWDYDLSSSPVLLTIRRDGKPMDIVVQAAKTGFIFAFDRVTGKPLWPIEERPVPKSNMEGNPAWPTQPFPTVIEPFARQSFTEKDLNPNLSHEDTAAITSQLRAARNEGLFTPPGTQETVQMPGNHGGVNWGLTAGDPTKGRFYVASFDLPAILKLEQSEEINLQLFSSPQEKGGALYRANCRICHQANLDGTPPAIPPLNGVVDRLTMDETRRVIRSGRNTMPPFAGVLSAADIDAIVAYLSHPVVEPAPTPPSSQSAASSEHASASAPRPGSRETKENTPRFYSGYGFILSRAGDPIIAPPWMTLSAYDMQTGKRLWQVPVGSAMGHEGEQTGVSRSKGGVVVTAGGLVLAATSEDRMLHFWNSDSGKLLFQFELPSVPMGVPAVFGAGGRQYIVVPASSYSKSNYLYPRGFGPKPAKNAYVALALPVRAKKTR